MFFRKSKKKSELEDGALVSLFQTTGDLAYLVELYQRYIHLVFGVCMKYLKDEEASKDMSMQIFEKLCIQLKHHEVNNFKSWLHVTVKNQCLMLLRSRKFRDEREVMKSIPDDYMEYSNSLHPLDTDYSEEDLVKMEKSIEKLPDEQKRCIQLFYLEQKCYKEIVELTGYELNKVKSYIQNGKRNLKNMMIG